MADANWATVLAGSAATLAAALAAVNLWLTGRRERLSWVRSALEETFANFLTAAYANRHEVKEIANIMDGEWSYRTTEEWWKSADSSHEEMINCASRMRILASNKMAESALALHRILDDEADMLAGTTTSADFRTRKANNQDQFIQLREAFTTDARKHLKVK